MKKKEGEKPSEMISKEELEKAKKSQKKNGKN